MAVLALELLDSGQGYVVQTWELEPAGILQIGRAKDCDVVIGSPYVSRAHAYLRHGRVGWELCVVSQKGVFVDGRRKEQVAIADGTVVWLSEKGPCLRFRMLAATPPCTEEDGSETISFDQLQTPLLVLEVEARNQQVEEIAETPYFKQLQQAARALRSRRHAAE